MYSKRRTKIELPYDVRYTFLYRKLQVIPTLLFSYTNLLPKRVSPSNEAPSPKLDTRHQMQSD